MKKAPWERLITLTTPRISAIPAAIKAYVPPTKRPSRSTWGRGDATSAPSRKYLGIRTPLQQRRLRCAPSPYFQVRLGRAPRRTRRIDVLDASSYLRDGAPSAGGEDDPRAPAFPGHEGPPQRPGTDPPMGLVGGIEPVGARRARERTPISRSRRANRFGSAHQAQPQ